MANVIVAFSKPEDAKNIKNILVRNGFQVNSACTSGAQALSLTEDLSSGIIVCGYRLTDMLFTELYEYMPKDFSMLMISSPSKWATSMPEDIVCLPMEMMVQAQTRRRRKQRQQPKQRSGEEQRVIDQAKSLLMERNNMTEEEAHRYIQKCSMDSGTNLIETAQMVISLINV